MGKKEYAEKPESYRELWPGAAAAFPWMDLLTAVPSQIFVVTTAKDAVRLERLKLVKATDIWYLTINLGFADPGSQGRFLKMLQTSALL